MIEKYPLINLAVLAQLVERCSRKAKASGSIPESGSNFNNINSLGGINEYLRYMDSN